MYYYGSIPIMVYAINGDEVPPPPHGFFLLTDHTDFLLTDHTPLQTAGA
jgi:hypothetical protein